MSAATVLKALHRGVLIPQPGGWWIVNGNRSFMVRLDQIPKTGCPICTTDAGSWLGMGSSLYKFPTSDDAKPKPVAWDMTAVDRRFLLTEHRGRPADTPIIKSTAMLIKPSLGDLRMWRRLPYLWQTETSSFGPYVLFGSEDHRQVVPFNTRYVGFLSSMGPYEWKGTTTTSPFYGFLKDELVALLMPVRAYDLQPEQFLFSDLLAKVEQ